MKISIINGPNLNLIGRRQPEIYGHTSFESMFPKWIDVFPEVQLTYFQSNHEGELIDRIQSDGYAVDGIIFNPGAYAHSSYALKDALLAVPAPIVEVHLSNIMAREAFRRQSLTAESAKAMIVGMGMHGYQAAIRYLMDTQNQEV